MNSSYRPRVWSFVWEWVGCYNSRVQAEKPHWSPIFCCPKKKKKKKIETWHWFFWMKRQRVWQIKGWNLKKNGLNFEHENYIGDQKKKQIRDGWDQTSKEKKQKERRKKELGLTNPALFSFFFSFFLYPHSSPAPCTFRGKMLVVTHV